MKQTMLWYKAWRETRTRFVVIACVLTAFCLFCGLSYQRVPAPDSVIRQLANAANYSQHVYTIMYSGTAKGTFALLVMFLGLGGLLRERTHHCALFTLSLPVSRARLLATFAAVGLGELVALALLPAVLIPLFSLFVRQSYPLHEALHFSILWIGVGSLIFAASLFLASVFEGEYTAPAVCYVVFMLDAGASDWRPLRPWRLNLPDDG